MTVSIAPGDRLECKLHCSDLEQGSTNTFYLEVLTTSGASTTDLDAAIFLDSTFSGDIKNFIADTANYNGFSVRVANELPLKIAQFANAGAGPGVAGAIGLPRQTSGLIQFRTDQAGPGGRGRLYMPFPPQSANQTLGQPIPAYVASLATFGSDIRTLPPITGALGGSLTTRFVLWSKKQARMIPITQVFGSNAWATQKRRGTFGRPNL